MLTHRLFIPPTRSATKATFGKLKLIYKHAFLESGCDSVHRHGSEDGRCQAWPGFSSLARLVPHRQQAETCQQFDVCGYEELQVLHGKGIAIGKTSK